MKLLNTAAALVACLVTFAQAGSAEAQQTTDQSGALTLQFTVAKYVEFISHEPGRYNVADTYTGTNPGMPIALGDGHVMRELRANTPFKLSVLGVNAENMVTFTSAAGTMVQVAARCRMWESAVIQADQPHEPWPCTGSGAYSPRESAFASLSFWLASVPFVHAGLYSATVYFQIEAQ